jgi:hypothetical protein
MIEDETSSGSMKKHMHMLTRMTPKPSMLSGNAMAWRGYRPRYLSPPTEDAKHYRDGKERKLSIYLG